MTTLRGPIDFCHGDGIGKEVFGELTGYGARGGLFDFGKLDVEEGVEEG